MALTHDDFKLADETLQSINDYIAARAQAYADAGADAAGEVAVTFTWTPEFGRIVAVRFDNAADVHEVEGPFQ